MPNEAYDVFSPEVGLNEWMQQPDLDLGFFDSELPSDIPTFSSGAITNPISAGVNLTNTLSGSEVGSILAFGKKSFTDTADGFIQGLDTDGRYKWYIGNVTSYIDWNVTTADTFTIAGTLIATAGTIGGWNITATTLYALSSGTPSASPNNGIVLTSGSTSSIAIYEGTAKRIVLGNTTGSVFGLLGYATNGTTKIFELSDTQQMIAGFLFTDTQMSAVSGGNTTIVSSGATAFAAGPTGAPTFTATQAGLVTASNIVLSGLQAGSSVDGQYLVAASVASAAANLALRGWTQTCAFSVTDADTVAWGAGTFTASDGTSYSIGAGNTGNMSAKTYIYLDIAVSTTAYQTTTTAATAVGNGKVMVAIAQNATGEATFMLLNNNSYNIDGSNLVVGTVTTNEIAATTIVGGNINTLSISGKTVLFDTGTVGGWTLASGTLSSGSVTVSATAERILMGSATAPLTGVGIFIGKDGSDYELRAGDPSGRYIHWDGTALTINGTTVNAQTTFQIAGTSYTGSAANLNTLTGGATTNADALHTHSLQTLQDKFDVSGYFAVDIDVTTEASTGSLSGGISVLTVGSAGPLFFAGGLHLTPTNSNTTHIISGSYNETGPSAGANTPLLNLLLSKRFYITFKCSMDANTNDDFYIGITDQGGSSTPSNAHEMAMFHFDNGTLKCISATGDGVNTESTTPTNVSYNVMNQYSIFRDSSSVKFYVNNTLVATHSTYIPNSGSCYFAARYIAGASGNHNAFIMSPVKLYVNTTDWTAT